MDILSPSADAARSYLDLLKRTLTRISFPERYTAAGPHMLDEWPSHFQDWLRERRLALVSVNDFDPERRAEGRDWPTEAETMIGLRRLDNVQECIERILADQVPGDLFEAGVWRGGASIFARAVLKAYGVVDRTVWLADSFQGLPKPDANKYPRDRGDLQWTASELAVSLETVKENFRRYGLLDQQVVFLPGWFRDTLPAAGVKQLALLRLDGDLYESTMIALRALYPKLSAGGYLIVDDYGALECCRAAVEDFRAEFDISEEIIHVDWTGVYWRVERPISPILDPLKSESPTAGERNTTAEYEPALHTLLTLYECRPDLQAAFPEAAQWDFRRLVDWARRTANGELGDSSSDLLRPYVEWFVLNSVDLAASGSVPWDVLESTTLASANPLPHTLRQMKSGRCPDISDHLITLGFLVREFDLKRILEVGTRDGYSTVALVEAASAIGGEVLSIDIEPCLGARELLESLGLTDHWRFLQANALDLDATEIPQPIDLLFIDTFHLYSQTLAELRKFVPYLRSGSWIVLHDSVSFHGVSKALLETVQSLNVKPRFYSFVHRNGLSLVRI